MADEILDMRLVRRHPTRVAGMRFDAGPGSSDGWIGRVATAHGVPFRLLFSRQQPRLGQIHSAYRQRRTSRRRRKR